MDKDRKVKALEFLQLFDGNVEDAITALSSLKVSDATESALPAMPPRKHKNRVSPDAETVIQVVNATKTYKLGRNKVSALNGVSIEIKQGEFVVITGTSGSGKSTLLQLIGGLDRPTTGQVIINGQDIRKLSDRSLSKFRNQTIGFVFQFFYLQPFLKLSVNLEVPGMFARIPSKQRAARVKELADAVGLSERLNHLPKELSGGQMQRAAIARALLNQPKILLADEPTGNLDQTNSKAIIELFHKVREQFNTTVILVTHDMNIAQSADRIISLSDGLVVTS